MPSGWILSILLIATAAVSLAVWFARTQGKRGGPPKEPEPPIGEIIEQPEMLPSIDRDTVQQQFYRRYREIADRFSIPKNVRYVDKMVDLFSLKDVRITHYCWKADDAIHTFPVWDSVEKLLKWGDSWASRYRPGDENNLSKLTYPISKIQSFLVTEETGEVVLRHLNYAGQEAATVFCGDSSETFERLIPEKQLAFIRRRNYLSSSQNIADLKGGITELRNQLLRGGITREEYERLKIAFVLRM